MKEKMQHTMDVFREYEKRFLDAQANLNENLSKDEIIASLKSVLGINEQMIPTVHDMKVVCECEKHGITLQELLFQTWENFYGTATLYLPNTDKKLPLVFLCIGHGKQGRKSESYVQMSFRLAKLGMAVLAVDNIGQGARLPQGHTDANAPFVCGTTLQGLIVSEMLGLIRYMKQDGRFDPEKFGACGNSGGGTLTMLLSALAPELSVIASSGYPSEFGFLFQKERKHCACNLLPNIMAKLEMWQIYGTFAPKPLLLSQGTSDNLIPFDLGKRCHRKVKNAYIVADAEDKLEYALTPTKHSWEIDDIRVISNFLSRRLLDAVPDDEFDFVDDCFDEPLTLPQESLNVTELCREIFKVQIPNNLKLAEIFPPKFKGKAVKPDEIIADLGYGDVMQVLAQFECVLDDENNDKGN